MELTHTRHHAAGLPVKPLEFSDKFLEHGKARDGVHRCDPDQEAGQIAEDARTVNLTIAPERRIVMRDRVYRRPGRDACVFPTLPEYLGIGPIQNVTGNRF